MGVLIMRNLELLTEVYDRRKLRTILGQADEETQEIVELIEKERPNIETGNDYYLEKFFRD